MQNPIQKFENFDELQLPYISLLFADFIIILILITTRVKTYFHLPIFTMWQVKDCKEGNNFILSTTFENASFPWQNAIENCNTKTEKSCKFSCKFPHSGA